MEPDYNESIHGPKSGHPDAIGGDYSDVPKFEPLQWGSPPPSRDLKIGEVPKSRLWEVWAKEIQDHPSEWVKLPHLDPNELKRVRSLLNKVPGMEAIEEDGGLYVRYQVALPAPGNSPLPSAQPLPAAMKRNDVQSRQERIEEHLNGAVPDHLSEPAIKPLAEGEFDRLMENPPGPIMGEG